MQRFTDHQLDSMVAQIIKISSLMVVEEVELILWVLIMDFDE